MSLDNLVGRTLEKITPDSGTITRLMNAAQRNIADAKITAVSAENRFDAAYKAIMQLANVALQVNGYRTLTSVPGHHRTMIQALGKTVGLGFFRAAISRQHKGARREGEMGWGRVLLN